MVSTDLNVLDAQVVAAISDFVKFLKAYYILNDDEALSMIYSNVEFSAGVLFIYLKFKASLIKGDF